MLDCEQSLESFSGLDLLGECAMRREKRGRLSSLPPSVTRVVIYASREFRSTEKEKRNAARRLSLFLIFEFFFLSIVLQVRSSKLAKHSKYAPADGNRYDGIYKVSAVRQCTPLSRFDLG